MEKELCDFLIVFEVVGLQYFSLRSLRDDEHGKRPSRYRLAHLVFMTIFVNSQIIGLILTDGFWSGDLNVKGVLNFMIDHSMNVGYVMATFISLFQSYWSTENIKKVFFNNNKMVQIYRQEFDITTNLKKVRDNAVKKSVYLISFFAAIQAANIFANLKLNSSFLHMAFGMIPGIFLTLSVLKVLFYVSLVNHQLEFLKKTAERIIKREEVKTVEFVNRHVINVMPKPNMLKRDSMKKLQAAWKVYSMINENSEIINASLGWTVLTFLISLTIGLTVSSYKVFVILVGGLSLENLPGTLCLPTKM